MINIDPVFKIRDFLATLEIIWPIDELRIQSGRGMRLYVRDRCIERNYNTLSSIHTYDLALVESAVASQTKQNVCISHTGKALIDIITLFW